MAAKPHRKSEIAYGVTVDLVGQTKVSGQHYLTDSLATSVLNRQLEKKVPPGTAKFLADRIHFSRSESSRHRIYRRDVPYEDVRRIYTFPGNKDLFMLCVEGDYEGGRVYYSFRVHNPSDISTIKTIIYGDPGHTLNRPYNADSGHRPTNVIYTVEQPQYSYVTKEYVATPQPPPRTPSPVYLMREKPPSPVVIRRVSTVQAPATPVQPVTQRQVYVTEAPEPVVYRPVQQETAYVQRAPTVYAARDTSPVMVRRSVSRPASIVYLDEPKVQEETVRVVQTEPPPQVLRRVTVAQPAPVTTQATVLKPVVLQEVAPVTAPVQTYKSVILREATPPPRPASVHKSVVLTEVEPEPEPLITGTLVESTPVVLRKVPVYSRPNSIAYEDQTSYPDMVDQDGLILKRIKSVYS